MGNGTYTLPETTKAHLGAMLYSFREGTSLKIYFVWYHRGFFRTNHVSWLECSSCYGILSLKRSIIDPFCSPPSFQMMLDYTREGYPDLLPGRAGTCSEVAGQGHLFLGGLLIGGLPPQNCYLGYSTRNCILHSKKVTTHPWSTLQAIPLPNYERIPLTACW